MIRTVSAVIAILGVAYGAQVVRAHYLAPAVLPENHIVPVVSSAEVLALIRQGKKVVFVDAREHQEWAEEHIPGAINVSLREVSHLDRRTLADSDLVVAYCVKDFRGFEVAKALREQGVEQAHILAEFGINGWKRQGLPTTSAARRTEGEGLDLLARCARDSAECLAGTP
jgi:rhodanese-related sulfurtransferase